MSMVSQGATITLAIKLNDPTSGAPTDPSSLQFQLIAENQATPSVVIGPYTLGNPFLVRTGVGSYQYTWTVPATYQLGGYQAQWLAIVNGVTQFNFDEVTVVAPSMDPQSAQAAIALSTDSHIIVADDHLFVRFDITPKVASIPNATFNLFRVQGAADIPLDYDSTGFDYNDDTYDNAYEFSGDPGASNVFVATPFRPIQPADYNSIGRWLTLYFNEQMTPNAQYMLSISGVIDAVGRPIPDAQYLFSVPSGVYPSVEPIQTPILVEDHSIAQTPFTSLDIIQQLNPTFYIVNTDPPADLVFIDPNYSNGRITVEFNAAPDSSYLNSTYFVLQCKPLSRGFNRWQTVPGYTVTADDYLPYVYVDVPSTDATPVFDLSGTSYYLINYKYRLKISQNVALTAQPPYDNLECDQWVNWMVDPVPFLVDPDIIQGYFPEATLFEIAELIYDASQEALDLFDDGIYTQPITPTIQTTLEDYVIALVCCNLQRVYEFGGSSAQVEISLGDLTVQTNNPTKPMVDRSNATTWCELAGVIRNEVYNLSVKSGMKAVLKGSRYWNPIPRRRIEFQEWRSWGWDRDSDWRRDWNEGWGR